MSQETQDKLETQSQELLQGRLKHVRTAALALALVPLAAVAANTAGLEDTGCPASAGICGTVFYDANNNGIQDAGETGISGASVTITYTSPDTGETVTVVLPTNSDGLYQSDFLPTGVSYTVSVQIPPGTAASPANQGSDDTVDSDGVPDGLGNSVAHLTLTSPNGDSSTDFGFTQSGFSNPGTGTPGYWKNHPEAWPVSSITVGTRTYTVAEAIAVMSTPVTKDKTYTMFASLVSAMLNVQVGNDSTCVSEAITAGQAWMTTYGPAGSGVAASSYAWKIGEPVHRLMDNYNNGMLCAPHRE